jgi:salicylate hydroxylase
VSPRAQVALVQPKHVSIAGAGIAGLVAAVALLRRGFEVEVYEQAAALREVGAGVQIGPNGSRVLIALGLGDALAEVVSVPDSKVVRAWRTGEEKKLFDLSADCLERFGAPYWMVHRADLQTALADAARALKPDVFHLGRKLVAVEQDGEGVSLAFETGAPARTDLLIGADGVHSVVRAAVGRPDAASYTGILAWRGVVPAASLPDSLRRPVGVNWIGPGGHVVVYPMRGGTLFNFVAFVESARPIDESWSRRGAVAECLKDFEGWHPEVIALIERLEEPHKWALYGRAPFRGWSNGRACLVGDACHPTLPFLAQGANMAIEDGMILARCLEAAPDHAAAFERFEALRWERTAGVVAGSRQMADRFHNPALAERETALAYMDREWAAERVKARYDWLFDYDATSAPLGPWAGSGRAPQMRTA